MTSTRHTQLLALVLAVMGLSIFGYKVFALNYPLTPKHQTTVWDLEILLDFSGRNEAVRIETFIPALSSQREILKEQFYNGAFGLGVEDVSPNRRAIWTYRSAADRKVLRYRARLLGESDRTPLPAAMQKKLRRDSPRTEDPVQRQAFLVWSSALRRQSADDSSLANLIIDQIFNAEAVDEIEALLPGLPDRLARLSLARDTLVAQGIPARIANGIFLDGPSRRAQTHAWLEYHVDGKDRRFFPGSTPSQFLSIWYGNKRLITARGVSELDYQIAIQPARLSTEGIAMRTIRDEGGALGWLSFGDLPLTTQLVYKVLVTIPVGILILVFLRQFIGLTTLGTFMPVLIGIAFRETALLSGIALFVVLIAAGLAMRFYLEHLKLLLVPRLAVVLVFIVLCMTGMTILMNDAGQDIGLSISLFPMVILTMTIERMSIVWEESSPADAIKQGMGSLFVAAVTYLAMSHDYVEYIMFHFLELLLIIMALCLLMGKYTGLRFNELIRFRELAAKS